MKTWKRNALIAGVLVIVCAGIYLNWLYTDVAPDLTKTLDANKVLGEATLVLNDTSDSAQTGSDTISEANEYFAKLRLSRQTTRQQAIHTLQETISYAEGSDISSMKKQLEQLIADALAESQIESLILAKGYADCVAYISTDGVSLAVSAPKGGLTQNDVSLLADIVIAQTDFELSDIRVIGVE